MKKDVLMKFTEGVKQLIKQCMEEEGESDNIVYIGIAFKLDDEGERIASCYTADPSELAICLSGMIARLVAANGLPEIWIDEIVSKARRMLNQCRETAGDELDDE